MCDWACDYLSLRGFNLLMSKDDFMAKLKQDRNNHTSFWSHGFIAIS